MKTFLLLAGLIFTPVAHADTSMSWAYQATPNPIQVTPQANSNVHTELDVDANGGTLQLKAPDGSLYVLELPKNSVLTTTTISMTLLDSVGDLPVKTTGPAYGVQLGPDGLVLNEPALLKITPAQDIPINEQIFLSYRGAGQELMIPAVLPTKEIQIQLEHFSGYVAARGYDQDLTAIRDRLGGNTEDLINSAMADKLARFRERAIASTNLNDIYEDLPAITDEFIQKVVVPRVAAAGNSCGEGLLAMQTILSLSRRLQILGVETPELDAYFSKIDIAKNDMQCMDEEYLNCRDHHVVHRIKDLWLAHEKRRQVEGNPNPELFAAEGNLVEACLQFQFEFQSSGVMKYQFNSNMVGTNLPFHFSRDQMKFTGGGTLTNTLFQFYNTNPKNCTVQSKTGDGSFNIMDMVFFGNTLGDHPQDIALYYIAGPSTETWQRECSNEPNSASPAGFSGWTSIFMMHHVKDDFVQTTFPPGFRFKGGWKFNPGSELFAERSWNYPSPGGDVESGLIRIFHRPK